MKRINTPTAVNGKFVEGDPSTGRAPTQLSSGWFNSLQETIAKFLEHCKLTLPTGNAADNENQLIEAMQAQNPAGEIRAFHFLATPSASFWHPCDGTSLPINKALFLTNAPDLNKGEGDEVFLAGSSQTSAVTGSNTHTLTEQEIPRAYS